MAGRQHKMIAPIAGIAAAILVAGAVAAALAALLLHSGGAGQGALPARLIERTIAFTLTQAGLSTFLSLAFGLAAARAFARVGKFPLRSLMFDAMSLPIVIPGLIAIFGIVSIYGNNGVLAQMLRALGWRLDWNLYGLTGIILAHVFFNMPLAVRLLLPAWRSIPDENVRLARQLGIRGWRFFRLIEWPFLRRYLPRAGAAIFFYCVTSFAVVLTLGGGPKSMTLEVLVFQSLRYDSDPAAAASVAILGMALSSVVLAIAQWSAKSLPIGQTHRSGLVEEKFDRSGASWLDGATLIFAGLFILPPFAAILLEGLWALAAGFEIIEELLSAIAVSMAIALPAAFLATALAYAIANGESALRRRRTALARTIGLGAMTPIMLSPMALALGLYLWMRQAGEGGLPTIIGIVLTNALAATPFLAMLLRPAIERARERHEMLCQALGMSGWARFSVVDWPHLRGEFGAALALACAFSLGDLVAVGIYGDPAVRTLTMLLYDQMSAYRMDGAAATALVLLLVVAAIYRSIERVVGGRHAA